MCSVSQTRHRVCCTLHPRQQIISIFLVGCLSTQGNFAHTQLCFCTYLYEVFLLLVSTLQFPTVALSGLWCAMGEFGPMISNLE